MRPRIHRSIEGMSIGSRDAGGLLQRADQKGLAASLEDVTDRGTHQTGGRGRGGDEYPFVPHVLHDRLALPRIELSFREVSGDRITAHGAFAVQLAEGN